MDKDNAFFFACSMVISFLYVQWSMILSLFNDQRYGVSSWTSMILRSFNLNSETLSKKLWNCYLSLIYHIVLHCKLEIFNCSCSLAKMSWCVNLMPAVSVMTWSSDVILRTRHCWREDCRAECWEEDRRVLSRRQTIDDSRSRFCGAIKFSSEPLSMKKTKKKNSDFSQKGFNTAMMVSMQKCWNLAESDSLERVSIYCRKEEV